MPENKVIRKMFGPENDELRGEYGILCEEELSDLYRSSSIVCVENLGCSGLVRMGKKPLGRPT
jgi:hypothetical protein